MASSVDYVFDPYVVDGYAPADYVADPFIEDGYVSGIVTGAATLSAQASVSSSGGFLQQSTASASAVTSQTASAVATRTSTASASAVTSQTASAVATRAGTSSSSSVFSVLSSGVQTKQGVLSISGAWNASIIAVATVSPGANISASATLSSSADRIRLSSATLAATTEDTQWQDPYSWDWPGLIWGPNFAVSAVKAVGATLTYELPVTATLSADGDRTAVANITAPGFASVAVDAVKLVDASATLDSAFTADFAAQFVGSVQELEITANASLSASGIYQIAGYPEQINGVFAQTTDGDRIARGVATLASTVTQTTDGERIRFGTVQITTNATLSADADRVAEGIVLQASVGTLSAQAKQTKGPYQLSIGGVFNQSCNGGRLRDGTATLNAFNSILSALTIFNIDPFRVYTIPTENRLCIIEQETRIFNVKSENRLNTVGIENRTFAIPSETRALIVQPLKLVEEAGTLDRREG